MHLNYLRPVISKARECFLFFSIWIPLRVHHVRRPWGGMGRLQGLMAATFMFTGMAGQHFLSIPLWFWKHTSLVQHSGWIDQGILFNTYWEPLVKGFRSGIGDAKASLWWSMSQTSGRHTKDKGHSFNMFIKHEHCAEDTAVNKTHKNLCLRKVYVDVMGDHNFFP